nr:unnamed protein product [Leishmania braziliensis]
MELQTQQHFCLPCPRPCTTSLVWMCLACGELAPYERASYYSTNNDHAMSGGFDLTTALSDREAAAYAYSSSPPESTPQRYSHLPCGRAESSYRASHYTSSSSSSSGVAAPATATTTILASSLPTLTPLRQAQQHSCVNDASDSYLSQAASSNNRQQHEQQLPLSVMRRITSATVEDVIHRNSVGSVGERRKRCEGALFSAEVFDLRAGEEAFGNDEVSAGGSNLSSRCQRAPTEVTAPDTPQLSTPLGNIRDDGNVPAATPRAPAVVSLPQPSAACPAPWRDADFNDAQSLSSAGARSGQQEEDVTCSLTALLAEEHLIGSREMRFCCCCGEVRCAEIRKVTELLPARATVSASYGDAESDEPLDFSVHAAESVFQPSEAAQWRSPPPQTFPADRQQQTQPRQSAESNSRKEISSVHLVALSLARLLLKVKAIAVAAVYNLHPLSPALPKAYFSRHGDGDNGETAVGDDEKSVSTSDSAPLSVNSISRPPLLAPEGRRLRYPLQGPREMDTNRATPLAYVPAEMHPLPCLASVFSVTGGGTVEDLNSVSLDSSELPSWAFTAPDEEDTYRAEEADESLVIQNLRGGVQSDEDVGTRSAEDAHACVRRLHDGSLSLSAIAGTTAATRVAREQKEKWNSISVSEALWRLVLPSLSAPFLPTTSKPSTAAADRAFSLDGRKPLERLMDWVVFPPRRGAVESTASSAVVTSARPYRGFRGDVEEAISQLNAVQLEVAKLRLQQVLAAVNAEQMRRAD